MENHSNGSKGDITNPDCEQNQQPTEPAYANETIENQIPEKNHTTHQQIEKYSKARRSRNTANMNKSLE